MRRKLQLLLVLLLIAGTTESGVRASTDCERWIASYRAELAHAKALRRIQAAQARLKRAAKRKLATYVKKPAAPKPLLTHFVRPHLTRQQMLDRFNLLCGDLPNGARPTEKLMEGKLTPVEFASEMSPFVPIEPTTGEESGLLPTVDTPPYNPPGTDVPAEPGGGAPGGPPIFAGGTPPGGNTPVVPDVPEPDSVVLLLTGIVGAAGVVGRRMRG